MTQEEKELLFKDICSRLPYGLMVDVNETKCQVLSISETKEVEVERGQGIFRYYFINEVLPYLRPMSSMTEEEKLQLMRYAIIGDGHIAGVDFVDWVERKNVPSYIDWLNEHHFDYRGLIEKGLALEATEGMYN